MTKTNVIANFTPKLKRIYFAGKVGKECWRHDLMPDLRGQAFPFQVKGAFIYAGPFFTSCDHGCWHGMEGVHGRGPDAGYVCCEGPSEPSHHQVVRDACVKQIRTCDQMVVYAGPDFETAHGTHTEMGMAHALDIPIDVYIDPEAPIGMPEKVWFPLSLARSVTVGQIIMELL